MYEMLIGKWVVLTDDRCNELGFTYNNKTNTTGLNAVPLFTVPAAMVVYIRPLNNWPLA